MATEFQARRKKCGGCGRVHRPDPCDCGKPKSRYLRAQCGCKALNVIRASRGVIDAGVRCTVCRKLFRVTEVSR